MHGRSVTQALHAEIGLIIQRLSPSCPDAEAKLAREAEICYATLALVTDYDSWHPDHDSVTVELIIANLTQNALTAQRTIAAAVERLSGPRTCACKDALATAIITRPEQVPENVKRELAPIIGKYIR